MEPKQNSNLDSFVYWLWCAGVLSIAWVVAKSFPEDIKRPLTSLPADGHNPCRDAQIEQREWLEDFPCKPPSLHGWRSASSARLMAPCGICESRVWVFVEIQIVLDKMGWRKLGGKNRKYNREEATSCLSRCHESRSGFPGVDNGGLDVSSSIYL